MSCQTGLIKFITTWSFFKFDLTQSLVLVPYHQIFSMLAKTHLHSYWSVNSTTGKTLGQICWDWRACKIGACIILIFLVAIGAFIAYVMYQKYCCMRNLCKCEKSQEKWHVNFYFAVNSKTGTSLDQNCWDWRPCKIGAYIILIFLVAVGAFIAYVVSQKYCFDWNLCECEKRQEKWLRQLRVIFYLAVNSTTGTTLGQSCWDWRAYKIRACIILIFLVPVGAFIAYVMYPKYCCDWNLCQCEKSQKKMTRKNTFSFLLCCKLHNKKNFRPKLLGLARL